MTFEKLRVHSAAERLVAMLDELFKTVPPGFAKDVAHARSAASSIVFNIGEAVGSLGYGKKANHFGIARGSADETRSVLRRLSIGRAYTEKQVAPPSILARTIAKMLTSIIENLPRDL